MALISIATIGIFTPKVTGSVYGLVRCLFVKPRPDVFDVVESKGRGKEVVANQDIKVSLDRYCRERAQIFQLFQDVMPVGGEIEKASTNKVPVFIDSTIPVRNLLLEQYPQITPPSGLFDIDLPLLLPPNCINRIAIETAIIPKTPGSPEESTSAPRPNISAPEEHLPSSPSGVEGVPALDYLTPGSTLKRPPDVQTNIEEGDEAQAEIEPGSNAPPTWGNLALSICAELMRYTHVYAPTVLIFTKYDIWATQKRSALDIDHRYAPHKSAPSY
ncbi:hypothetical protein BDV93DRAFT_552828 [Ceratobasidium sp. AG-I]|nr:hypothetical protein BDV93DRAFT_552828 [Ceratobasidium sp. AG-I]